MGSLSQLSGFAADAYSSARDLSGMVVGAGAAAAVASASSTSVAMSTVTYDDSSSAVFVEMSGVEVQDTTPHPVRSYKGLAI
jgi:hypothetical protein